MWGCGKNCFYFFPVFTSEGLLTRHYGDVGIAGRCCSGGWLSCLYLSGYGWL